MPKDRILPHNLEAEQSVLGCILMDAELQSELLAQLDESDFNVEAHADVFNAIKAVYAKNIPIDLITVSDSLDSLGKLDKVGGINYLTELVSSIPSTANYETHLEIVKRDSLRRKLIRASNRIIEDAYTSADGEGVLSNAEKEVYDISERNDRSSLTPINERFGDVLTDFEAIQTGNAVTGLKTGYKYMDIYTNGFRRGNLIILAARPSNGKTTLAMNIVENAALQSGAVCAVFALEMTKDELAQRMLCSVSGVDHGRIMRGELNEEDWQRLWAARKKLNEAKVFVDDTSLVKPTDIISKCRRLKNKHGLDLVVVDHIQLMSAERRTRGELNRQQEITEISRYLKMMAKELDVPVLALSQLSRLVTGRKGQKPVLSDLRESGAIEQDADIVMFIHRPDKVAEDEEIAKGKVMKNVAEILIEKNRAGATGSFELLFQGGTTKFIDLPPDYKAQFEKIHVSSSRSAPPEEEPPFEPSYDVPADPRETKMEDTPKPDDSDVPPVDISDYF